MSCFSSVGHRLLTNTCNIVLNIELFDFGMRNDNTVMYNNISDFLKQK
ncbi:MAG: hypothetical protein OEY51_05710 [Cyclobacteriaceae bacterium]|nr:hypothetical protein [Cyclobacteriaceae bacterium]